MEPEKKRLLQFFARIAYSTIYGLPLGREEVSRCTVAGGGPHQPVVKRSMAHVIQQQALQVNLVHFL